MFRFSLRFIILPFFSLCLNSVGIVSANHISIKDELQNDALPFSLSISGGVSLGSYEAGVNWTLLHYLKIQREKYELEKNSGINKKNRISLYPKLSSVSGASAGSINALFSAINWCVDKSKVNEAEERNTKVYHFKDTLEQNLFRDIWVDVGIEKLLPDPEIKNNYLENDGLFSRNAFNLAITNLKATLDMAIFREDCEVPFGMTVTRVKPGVMTVAGVEVKNQRFMIPFRIEADPRNKNKAIITTNFVNKNDPDMGNVMYLQGTKVADNENKYIISTDSLVSAILTSSAFPIAFGRKKLNYCLRELELTSSLADLKICPEGFKPYTDEFLDGGVFDNVPLGIAKALAEPKPTEKELNNKWDNWKKSARRYNYIYIDPGNLRNTSIENNDFKSSHKNKENKAKSKMTFGLREQLKFLSGAINTGRNYELYNILRGGEWSRQTFSFACLLSSKINNSNINECSKTPKYTRRHCNSLYKSFKSKKIIPGKFRKAYSSCVLNTSFYLETLYTINVDSKNFRDYNCNVVNKRKKLSDKIIAFRTCLLLRLKKLAFSVKNSELVYTINGAINDDLGDRRILLTTRFAPITGNMMANFGAFLDRPFREYDYYAGVYDAVNVIAQYQCERRKYLTGCLSKWIENLYSAFKINKSAPANTVFTLLVKTEHKNWDWLNDIHSTNIDTSEEALLVANLNVIFNSLSSTIVENNKSEFTLFSDFVYFSNNLLKNGYITSTSISSDFMKRLDKLQDEEISNWFYPITSRIASRLIQLENNEVEASNAPNFMGQLLGVSSLAVHSYIKNGDNVLMRHSSAPVNAIQQLLPYEFGVDARNGGLHVAWEPSVSLSKSFSVHFNVAPLIIDRFADSEIAFSQATVFLSYERNNLISSFGLGPTISSTWKKWSNSKQTNIGASLYAGLMQDKIRLTLGTRSFNNDDFYGDTIFINISITDVPGFAYWLFN